jgi:hypothetical protein
MVIDGVWRVVTELRAVVRERRSPEADSTPRRTAPTAHIGRTNGGVRRDGTMPSDGLAFTDIKAETVMEGFPDYSELQWNRLEYDTCDHMGGQRMTVPGGPKASAAGRRAKRVLW